MIALSVSSDSMMDILNIRDGVFAPIRGFLDEASYRSVVAEARLASGEPWGFPITLEIPESNLDRIRKTESVKLIHTASENAPVCLATLQISSVFKIKPEDIARIFGTNDQAHPGVAAEIRRSPWRVGGILQFDGITPRPRSPRYLTPAAVRARTAELGITSLVGFQTRNAIHRAHEYLQRIALEIADGLLIHPLTGWKKDGDASFSDIVASYDVMLQQFYPPNRVLFSVLETAMRYAGPREALFHAIIRRNYGCTHFIVGRDHAGVGGYYGRYEAQEFCRRFEDAGITFLFLEGPHFCTICGGPVTRRSCRHAVENPAAVTEVSGTMIRDYLDRGQIPPTEMMRPEVADAILKSRGCAPRA